MRGMELITAVRGRRFDPLRDNPIRHRDLAADDKIVPGLPFRDGLVQS
jgi:hypothetical protein